MLDNGFTGAASSNPGNDPRLTATEGFASDSNEDDYKIEINFAATYWVQSLILMKWGSNICT